MPVEPSPIVRFLAVAIFAAGCASPPNATPKSAPDGSDASVVLEASHAKALETLSLDRLRAKTASNAQ